MHGCDMPDESPSISIDHRIFRRRRSQAFYARSYRPSHTGQNPPRARLQAGARAQNRKCSSGTFLPPGGSASKVRPKGQAGTPLVHVVTTVARPGDAGLMRMPRHRSGEAELMLPPWYRPGEVESMLPPWQGPVKASLHFRPGTVQTKFSWIYAISSCLYHRGQGR
jgi:hypothetical protein